MARAIFLDSFSGAAADLPKGLRSDADVLAVLAKHPRVGTWDMDGLPWLRACIKSLTRDGLITEDRSERYPWHRYVLTEAGKAATQGTQP